MSRIAVRRVRVAGTPRTMPASNRKETDRDRGAQSTATNDVVTVCDVNPICVIRRRAAAPADASSAYPGTLASAIRIAPTTPRR